MQFQAVSQNELATIEGGMRKLERPEPISTGEPHGGMGYTGIMIHYTLSVSEHLSPC